MKLKFLGAVGGTVTGSGYLLTSDKGETILIDLGMFQGTSVIDALNFKPIEVEVDKLTAVVLTHAHLDHCGRLPILESLGFSGNVYLTEPTAELATLSLIDSANINKEDNPENALYTKDHVMALVKRFKPVGYNQSVNVGEFVVTFQDAGHIIGSASVEIEVDGKKIAFSGDLGNTPEDLSRPTTMIKSADIVVIESTYGDRLHPKEEPEDKILAEINAIEKTGGTLLIPAFSLERTQEILHIISHFKAKNLIQQETPVYLDSPMAQKATNIYVKYKSYLNDEIKKDFQTSDPFEFPGLHIVKDRKDSMALNQPVGPQVIIAGSGMMTGGRILEHARQLLIYGTTRLLIVGYQAEDTLGRQILEGNKVVQIGDQKIHVNATVSETQAMSSHADQGQLLNWLGNIQGVKRVIITHGEDVSRTILAEKIKNELKIPEVSMPMLNSEMEL